MSVKDMIAKWNNGGPNNSTVPPPKMVSTAPVKPKQAVQAPITISQSAHQKNQLVQTTTIVKPSDIKKKTPAQQIQTITKTTPEQATKTWGNSTKPVEGIKKQNSYNTNQNTWVKTQAPLKKQNPNPVVTNSNKFQIETNTISKPSDIKKKFEQDISGNSFHFIAPQPIKKVQSATIAQNPPPQNTNTAYEIERDVPRISVKQNAQKLAQFYNKKQEEQIKPKVNVPIQLHQQIKPQEPHQKPQQRFTEVHHEPTKPQYEQKVIIEVKPQENVVKQEIQGETLDIATRIKNRNKMKRAMFDSDDD